MKREAAENKKIFFLAAALLLCSVYSHHQPALRAFSSIQSLLHILFVLPAATLLLLAQKRSKIVFTLQT
jgi:hypothetical protein